MDDEVIEKAEEQAPIDEVEAQEQDAVETAEAQESQEGIECESTEEKPQGQPDRPWVKQLRQQHKELVKQNRELAAQLQAIQAPKAPQALGEKPKLADFDYDADDFESALESWHAKKRAHDDQEAQRKAQIEAQEREWSGRLERYAQEKQELADPDFDEAEWNVQHLFSETQQGIMLHGLESPARIVALLGRDQAAAEKLSKITDPVKFAFAIADYRRDKTMQPTKKAPPPERVISGGARAPTSDTKLDRLRDQAAKTGDYSAVVAYKSQLRNSKK